MIIYFLAKVEQGQEQDTTQKNSNRRRSVLPRCHCQTDAAA